jgi:hypothetical protein
LTFYRSHPLEAHTLYILLRDAPSEGRLKDEIDLWAKLAIDEPNESEVYVSWPAISQTDGDALLEYVTVEACAKIRLQTATTTSQQDSHSAQIIARAVQLPPIRYLPTMSAIEQYLRFRTIDTVTQEDSPEGIQSLSESSEDEMVPFAPKDPRARQSDFFSQYNEYNTGRRVFRTARGWLGNGHQSAQPGDEVWLIPQCTVPFILRPMPDGKYNMVGVCYVHGMMFRAKVKDQWLKVVDEILIS